MHAVAAEQRDPPPGLDGAEPTATAEVVTTRAAVGASTRTSAGASAPAASPADLVPRSRPPATPRWLWIAALIAGAVGVIAFAVAAIRGGDVSSADPNAPASSGSSFPSGLVLGAGIGLAIGWVLGRRTGQSR